MLRDFSRRIGSSNEEELKWEFLKILKNLTPDKAEEKAKEILVEITTGGKYGNLLPVMEQRVGKELVEESARYILELNDKSFVESFKKLSQLLNEPLEESEENFSEKIRERIEAEKRAWENFKKALLVYTVENGQKARAYQVKAWIEGISIPKEEEEKERRQPLLNKEDALKVYNFLTASKRQIRQQEIFGEKEFQLYKEARFRMHTLSYYALKSILGKPLFKDFEECVNRASTVGGYHQDFKHCVEKTFDTRINQLKAQQQKSLNELMSPMGWLFGYVKIAEVAFHTIKKNLALTSKAHILYGEERVEKELRKTYKALSEPGLSEARATYLALSSVGKIFGGVKISEEYEQNFLRGLVGDSLRKFLENVRKRAEASVKVEDKIALSEINQTKDNIEKLLDKFEDGKIGLEQFITELHQIVGETKVLGKKMSAWEKRVLDNLKEEDGKITLKHNEVKLSEQFKLKLTDSGLVALNEKFLKEKGIDEENFVLDIKDKNLNLKEVKTMEEFARTTFAHLWNAVQKKEDELEKLQKIEKEYAKENTKILSNERVREILKKRFERRISVAKEEATKPKRKLR
jgi:hypothetical protein